MTDEQKAACDILHASFIFIYSLDTCNDNKTKIKYAKKHALAYVMQAIENNQSSYWKKVQEELDNADVNISVALSFMNGELWDGKK